VTYGSGNKRRQEGAAHIDEVGFDPARKRAGLQGDRKSSAEKGRDLSERREKMSGWGVAKKGSHPDE